MRGRGLHGRLRHSLSRYKDAGGEDVYYVGYILYSYRVMASYFSPTGRSLY